METTTCDNCGAQNRAGAKFCTHCGTALSRPDATPWPASQPPGTVMMESTAWDINSSPAAAPRVPAPPSPTYEDSRSPVSYTHLDVYKRQGQTLADRGR